jgi:hypothetical protein
MSVKLSPASRRFNASRRWWVSSFRGRPMNALGFGSGSAFARTSPDNSRSNSARPPSTVSINRPYGVVVSAHVSARERKPAPFRAMVSSVSRQRNVIAPDGSRARRRFEIGTKNAVRTKRSSLLDQRLRLGWGARIRTWEWRNRLKWYVRVAWPTKRHAGLKGKPRRGCPSKAMPTPFHLAVWPPHLSSVIAHYHRN